MAENKFMSTPYDKPADDCVAFMQIAVTDLPRAQKFYEDVFGWIFSTPYKPTVIVFKTGGQVMGALHVREDSGGVRPAILNYIKVADITATLEKVAAAGGEVIKEKWTEGGHTEMGEFQDPDGNTFGVLHWLM
jgi:uncharacterized protein